MAREAETESAKLEAGFETRLMARMRARRAPAFWGAWSWRLAPVFMAAAFALGALYYVTPQQAPQGDLHAVITAEYDYSVAQSFLNGE